MSTMTKVFIVLTAVLSIAVSCLFIAAVAQSANWKELAEVYEQRQLAELTMRMNQEAIAQSALAMRDDEARQLTQSLEAAQRLGRDLQNELADTRIELARQTNDRVAAEADRKALAELLAVKSTEEAAARQQNDTLLTQNIDLQTRNTSLNSRVLELSSDNAVKTDQIRNLQEKLYASEQMVAQAQQAHLAGGRVPSRVTPPAGVQPVAAPVVGPIRGEITAVDGSYASLNIGQSSGVAPGMTFMVYRGSVFVAELVVDGVRPEEAGGKLMTIQQAVRAGDAAVYGLESAGN